MTSKNKLFNALLFFFCFYINILNSQDRPNILIVIADDMGVDAMSAYGIGTEQPNTPNLDALADQGILFKNAWAYPTCSPSRAAMLTGRYPNKNGVLSSGMNLDLPENTLFEQIETITGGEYVDAIFGKWHLANTQSGDSHPNDQGADHYIGHLSSGVGDYNDWDRTENGVTANSMEYVTTHLTDEAIAWIDNQTEPWFVWMAHHAPHQPHHLPPDSLYTRTQTGGKLNKFLCMIESVDHEVGRLYNSLTQQEKDSTIVIFVGDNGTPNAVLQGFPMDRGKGTLYEGGIRVPMIVAGYGVDRMDEEEDALVSLTDIFATITELLETDLPGGYDNSFSFFPLLSDSNAETRDYNYAEYIAPAHYQAIRNEQYKLIIEPNGTRKFYDLLNDPLEMTDLIPSGLSVEQLTILANLEEEAEIRTHSWSCKDKIQNGIETDIDVGDFCGNCPTSEFITGNISSGNYRTEALVGSDGIIENNASVTYHSGSIILDPGFDTQTGTVFRAEIDPCLAGIDDMDCPNDNSTTTTNIGCGTNPTLPSEYMETVANDIRTIVSNNYPDHLYRLKQNDTIVPTSNNFAMDATPAIGDTIIGITSATGRPNWFFGVAVNGVKIAPTPATPFIFENTQTGEYNWSWVFEATNNQGNGPDKVALDCAGAHRGPQGYHYHANMIEYAETMFAGISGATVPPDPLQIGWAADGFPILYRYGPDENGDLVLLKSGYKLKEGLRPGDGVTAPCGTYSGRYTRDYEHVEGHGDLDECNGIERDITLTTVEGDVTFPYFYVITDDFPQVGRCFSGTPDPSFE